MATNNNNLPVKSYVKQYVRLLDSVFNAKKAFAYALAPVQILDGIRENATAFSVKTNNTPVVIGNYNEGADIGVGSGTSSTSRFGACTEVIYGNTDVAYTYNLSSHEAIDRATVNNDFNEAILERLELQTIAQTKKMNVRIGAYLSGAAAKEMTLESISDANVTALFNDLSKYFIDNEVDADLTIYVVPELYNAIVDNPLASTGKNSSVNIDRNDVAWFKNFKVVSTASKNFVEGDVAYATADGIVIPFVGASTVRTIESEDLDGVKIQARAKGGTFATDDNKVAIVKVTIIDETEGTTTP